MDFAGGDGIALGEENLADLGKNSLDIIDLRDDHILLQIDDGERCIADPGSAEAQASGFEFRAGDAVG